MRIFVILAFIAYASATSIASDKQDDQEQETQSRQSAPIKNWAAGHTSFRFIVSLRYKPTRSHFCGGSIISSTKVLTAAHCMVGQNPSLVDVAAGQLYKSSDSGDYEQIRDVSYISIHPAYDRKTADFDFAVLTVSSGFSWTHYIHAVGLGSATSGTVYVSGWGALTESGSLPDRLHYTTLPIVPNEECDDKYGVGSITSRMICAGEMSTGGKDSCQGDGGGPLTVHRPYSITLVGVVSWGFGCARAGYPGVYARVSAAQSWIASQ